MKTIIAGGRDYRLTEEDFRWLDALGITEVVNGGATGVDTDAKNWAVSRGIPVVTFHPDWNLYGKRAGPIRNYQMAQHAQQCILFPGGKGTASMKKEAENRGLLVVDAPSRKGTQ